MTKLLQMALTLSLLGGTAYADCPPSHKPPPRKVVPPRRPPQRPKDPPKHVDPPKCSCEGKPGPVGPQGPQGPAGPSRYVVMEPRVIVQQLPAVRMTANLRLGVMGAAFAPHGDWAWGPALQLQLPVSDRTDLVVSAGIAQPFTSTRESGFLVEGTLNRELGSGIGLGLGLHGTSIDGSANNGHIDGHYLGIVAGVTYTTKHLRLEVGPTLGGLRDDHESGTQFEGGMQGSLFVGGRW